MKLNQRVLVTSVFALLIFNSSVAQAWDWNSLKERSIQSVKAWWYGSGTSTQSSVSSASIHRKPELTVFGPKTYFVGDPITSDMFRVDNSARHKMNVRASGHVQVDYVLNGQNIVWLLPMQNTDTRKRYS